MQLLHDGDGRADVATGLFLKERTIGAEQDMIGHEERNAANRGGARAGERRVAVEAFEIVERPLLELLQDQRIILIRRARTELVPAVRDAAFEIRNDAAEMMRDHLEVRESIHDAGDYQS